MTIQINFKVETLSTDLTTLAQVIRSGSEAAAKTMGELFMGKRFEFQNISLTPFPTGNVAVNVTIEEFSLIVSFNGGF
jgi:hypothetical protein